MAWQVIFSRDGRALPHLTKPCDNEAQAKAMALAINSKAFQPLFARAIHKESI